VKGIQQRTHSAQEKWRAGDSGRAAATAAARPPPHVGAAAARRRRRRTSAPPPHVGENTAPAPPPHVGENTAPSPPPHVGENTAPDYPGIIQDYPGKNREKNRRFFVTKKDFVFFFFSFLFRYPPAVVIDFDQVRTLRCVFGSDARFLTPPCAEHSPPCFFRIFNGIFWFPVPVVFFPFKGTSQPLIRTSLQVLQQVRGVGAAADPSSLQEAGGA
jgi:hypothetical protein